MAQILPIKELRDTNKIDQLCSSSDEPIFITKNGYGKMVVMSMAAYEKRLAQAEILGGIMRGLEQVKSGETIDGDKFIEELRAKYGNETI